MPPEGSEPVLCLDGDLVLVQELAGRQHRRVSLARGPNAINATGVWHTADVEDRAPVLFVTAGWGTQHGPR